MEPHDKNKQPIEDQLDKSVSDVDKDEPKRETWNNKIDFLLACIGFSVGLGNVWRFPYLCYKNGGGAFLIPYFICVIFGGIPLFFLEVAVGQFMSQGGIKAWNICPIFQGIGWATTVIVFFLNCYYNIILTWSFYYMFASFTSLLPWAHCGNYWNSANCSELGRSQINFTKLALQNSSITNETKLIDPATEFWENKVLGISDAIDEVGTIKWDLALCLLLAWIIVYLCICQGIRTSGKVMYVTATSPYIFMSILLVRGATLPGALDGIIFYLKPEFSRLLKMEVWIDAGTQIFFSYSISLGALTALGSYNKFHHNSYRDSILFALANSGTSIFAGFVIFSTLGYMANRYDTTVDKIAEAGPGLAFIAYPTAVAQMPVAPLWSFFFFLMLILLGLDSQFVGVEGLVTAFLDLMPSLRKPKNRYIFIGFLCILQFAVGLSMVTNGGMYVFQLFDYYSGSRILLVVAFFSCIAISYVYGIFRFYDNIEMMVGFRINPYMMANWVFLSPAFCLAIFVMSTVAYSELTYVRPKGEYFYPWWAIAIGWSLAALSAMWIPIIAIYKLFSTLIRGKPLLSVFQPQGLKEHQLRSRDKQGRTDLQDFTPIDGNKEAPPSYKEVDKDDRDNFSPMGKSVFTNAGFENSVATHM